MRTRCYGLLALIVIAIVVRASVVVPAQTSDTNRNGTSSGGISTS